MKIVNKKNTIILTDLIPLIVILAFILIVSLMYPSHSFHYNNEIIDFKDGWISETGEPFSMNNLPVGDIKLTHDLSQVDIVRKRLCFETANTYLTAQFDGVTLYDYHTERPNIFGKSYGMYIHLIPIPESASSVTLILQPIYKGDSAYIKDIAVEDAGMFMADIYHSGLPAFSLCFIMVLFGVLMLCIGFSTLRSYEGNPLNFFSLGGFAIVVGIWSANDTLILQVFTQRPEIVRFASYICLIFISYFPISFLASATNYRNPVMLSILFGLNASDFVITITLSILGIKDVRDMLLFSHFNVAVAMFMAIYLMVRASKKRTVNAEFLHKVIVGMSFTGVGVTWDMIRYRLFPNSHLASSFFTRIGVFVFIVIMGIHLMRERTKLAVEQGRTELMKKLAYTDSLTELGNRAAFHEKEDEIRRTRTDCVVVQLDINFLKKVNDVYGHAEGDRHIINAAHIIRDSFSDIGISFRTGGDEFIVITHKNNISSVEKAISKMDKYILEYTSFQVLSK